MSRHLTPALTDGEQYLVQAMYGSDVQLVNKSAGNTPVPGTDLAFTVGPGETWAIEADSTNPVWAFTPYGKNILVVGAV